MSQCRNFCPSKWAFHVKPRGKAKSSAPRSGNALSPGASFLDGSIWTAMAKPISKATAVNVVPLWFINSKPTSLPAYRYRERELGRNDFE